MRNPEAQSNFERGGGVGKEAEEALEEHEKKRKKFLFIDDNSKMLGSLQRPFRNNPNVAFVECHSVEDALHAIAEHNPDVVFLDHSLTEGGNEGLEIADRLNGVRIYSTTANSGVVSEYQRRGIENIGKSDLGKFKSIIAA